MKVSVIIPGYRTTFIDQTLDSINNQTVDACEILYVHSVHTKAAHKINDLIKIAKGDAICILSDDDMLHPEFIEKTSKKMDEGYDIVYTDMQKIGSQYFIQPASEYNEANFKISTVPWMTSLIRKDVFDKVGEWDDQQIYQDYDFYYRCFKAGATGFHLKEPLFIYRIHPDMDSMSLSTKKARELMKKKHPEII